MLLQGHCTRIKVKTRMMIAEKSGKQASKQVAFIKPV